jgi:homoserine dehydrogenase
LNGTSNFVLDQLATGVPFDQAVRVAQDLGYAELDPQFDLDGTDAAHKLILLAQAAFGQNLPLTAIRLQGIDQLDRATLNDAQEKGQTVRLVAECRRVKDRLEASVATVSLDADHPLASVAGVDNRLLIEPEVGVPSIVSGKGAGRWPTTEAVMADLLDLKRECRIEGTIEVQEECVA